MSAKGGSVNGNFNYYGDIAGIVCIGPVYSLMGFVIDGKTVWPENKPWESGKVYAVDQVTSFKGRLWKCITSHTSSTSNQPGTGAQWTRFKVLRSASSNPYSFDVVGYGTAYFYWGTSTQTLSDGVLDAAGHPPYRNQAVIVLKKFLFGQGRTPAPNVEVLCERDSQQTLITSAANVLVDGNVNPVAIALDILTNHVTGLGLPNSKFDATTWNALGDILAADLPRYGLAPLLNRGQKARQFIAELLSYSDSWNRFNTAGVIEAGMFEHQPASAPTFTDATTIDMHDLVEEPRVTSDGWTPTVNEVFVKFTDRERSFKDGSEKAFNQSNRDVVGEPRPSTIERNFIIRREQAAAYASEAAKILGQPKATGTLTVRAEKAASIKSGTWFKFTNDAMGTSVICRCIEKIIMAPPSGRVGIKFETERALSSAFFRGAPNGPTELQWAEPELLEFIQFWQPPNALADGSDSAIGVLAARKNTLSAGLNLWLRMKDQTSYQFVGTTRDWASFGNLSQAYTLTSSLKVTSFSRTSNVGTITTETLHGLSIGNTFYAHGIPGTAEGTAYTVASVPAGNQITFTNTGTNQSVTALADGAISKLSSGWSRNEDYSKTLRFTLGSGTIARDMDDRFVRICTADEIQDATFLVIIFSAATPSTFEVCALRSAELVSGSTYALTVTRNKYGGVTSAFSTGDRLFIIYRENLPAFIHQSVAEAVLAGTGIAFLRAPAFNARNTDDPSETPVSTATRARATNVATIVTATPHRLSTGDSIMITGMTDSTYNTATPVGVTVTNATTFTYPNTGSDESTTADTTGVIDRALALVDAYVPTITWQSIKKNGVEFASGWGASPYATTDSFFIQWLAADNGGDLTYDKLEAVSSGGTQLTLWQDGMTPRYSQVHSVTFTLPVGTWTITGIAQDATNRVVRKGLEPIGGGSPITIVIA